MFCWEARAALDRQEAGWLAAGEARRLLSHLAGCAACSGERRRREDLVSLLRETGRIEPLTAPAGFEAAVLRAARARGRAQERPIPRSLRRLAPFPVAAAAAVVMTALMLSVLRGPVPRPDPATSNPAVAQDLSAEASVGEDFVSSSSLLDDGDDRIAPPREIPFTIREDLVGSRRGRIPMTTYVLEPPPAQAAVVRASL